MPKLFEEPQRGLSVEVGRPGEPGRLRVGYTGTEEVYGGYRKWSASGKLDTHVGVMRAESLRGLGIGQKVMCLSILSQTWGEVAVVSADLEAGIAAPIRIELGSVDPAESPFGAYNMLVCAPGLSLDGLVAAHRQRIEALGGELVPVPESEMRDVYSHLLQVAVPLG